MICGGHHGSTGEGRGLPETGLGLSASEPPWAANLTALCAKDAPAMGSTAPWAVTRRGWPVGYLGGIPRPWPCSRTPDIEHHSRSPARELSTKLGVQVSDAHWRFVRPQRSQTIGWPGAQASPASMSPIPSSGRFRRAVVRAMPERLPRSSSMSLARYGPARRPHAGPPPNENRFAVLARGLEIPDLSPPGSRR